MSDNNSENPCPHPPERTEGAPAYLVGIRAPQTPRKMAQIYQFILTNDEAEGADFAADNHDYDNPPYFNAALLDNAPPAHTWGVAFLAGGRLAIPLPSSGYFTVTAIVKLTWPWATAAPLLSILLIDSSSNPAPLAEALPDGTTQRKIKIDDYTWKLTAQIAAPATSSPERVLVSLYARCHVRYDSRYNYTTEDDGPLAPIAGTTDALPAPEGAALPTATKTGKVLDLGTITMTPDCGESQCQPGTWIEVSTSQFFNTTGAVVGDYGWHLSSEWGEVDLYPHGGLFFFYGLTWFTTFGGDRWQITLDLTEGPAEHVIVLQVRAARIVHDSLLAPDGMPYDHMQLYQDGTFGPFFIFDCAGTASYTGTFATPQFMARPASFTLALPMVPTTTARGTDVGGVLTPGGPPGTTINGVIPCSNPCNFTFTQTWRGWPQQAQMPIPGSIVPHYPPYPPRIFSFPYGA